MSHIAVIDIGKTNAKLALVNSVGLHEITVITQPNRVLDSPPWPHFDLAGIWAFIQNGFTCTQCCGYSSLRPFPSEAPIRNVPPGIKTISVVSMPSGGFGHSKSVFTNPERGLSDIWPVGQQPFSEPTFWDGSVEQERKGARDTYEKQSELDITMLVPSTT